MNVNLDNRELVLIVAALTVCARDLAAGARAAVRLNEPLDPETDRCAAEMRVLAEKLSARQ